MARGGARDGAGRPRKAAPSPAKIAPRAKRDGQIEPLDYMLAVINNPEADQSRRDRMAIAAAPYRHARAEEVGKKELRQASADQAASEGKFAVPAGPKLVVNNRK